MARSKLMEDNMMKNAERDKRINVLHVIGTMDRGGAETFLMNVLRNIDSDKFRFVFLCFGDDPFDYEQEAVSLGASIRRIPPINIKKHFIRNVTNVIKIIKEEKIDILHAHMYYLSVYSIVAASCAGVKTRIVHSHNTRADDHPSFIKILIYKISSLLINALSTNRVACGRDAGISLFGGKSYTVINNGIDLQDFAYNHNSRAKIRKELQITNNDTVLLSVARFYEQKNHTFLIDIYAEYIKYNAKSKLVLVGDGPLRGAIEKKIKRFGITQNVIFAGKRSDTSDFYSAADIFVFPSLYEGLPVTLVEAQANGLRCLISDTIDEEAKLTDTVEFYPLSKSAKQWANKVSRIDMARNGEARHMQDSTYNITRTVEIIEKMYIDSLGSQR